MVFHRGILMLIATLLVFVFGMGSVQPVVAQGTVDVGNPLEGSFGTDGRPNQSTTDEPIVQLQVRLGQLLSTMLRGIAALSLLPIVVGGFQMIISQGNEDKINRGKQTLYFGIVGLVLALLAVAIFRTLFTFVFPS